MYLPNSTKAAEFLCHEEVMQTLAYAQENKNNLPLIQEILAKARLQKGLTHREASVLLACPSETVWEELYQLAEAIKLDYYGKRIVLFAPLYLSNYCVNSCVYCPYHAKNKHICRKKLTQEEIKREVIALQDMGHKRLALEAGEDPLHNPIEYILESIDTVYHIQHKNGAIRRVNVNIAATTVENYRKLHDAGIGTYILFQETYHKEQYEKLHPAGPKHNYDYHTEAMDRAMQGGIDDVGLGVLFGLQTYPYELAGLLMHAEHLEATYGVGPHTISVPRIKHADDIDPTAFDNSIDDETFAKICTVIRIAVPYTGMIMSTREGKAVRERALQLGISQMSGASCTSVGGYDTPEPESENSAQFDVSDRRTLDEVVRWLMELGYIPSFCTACYRAGRNRRPVHVPLQERSDSKLLSPECPHDIKRIFGGLCKAGNSCHRKSPDSKGTAEHSKRKSTGNCSRTHYRNGCWKTRFPLLILPHLKVKEMNHEHCKKMDRCFFGRIICPFRLSAAHFRAGC